MKTNTAKFVEEVTVVDPVAKDDVAMSVYIHENGGMFAIDSSFIEQMFGDDEKIMISDPFNKGYKVELLD